MSTTMASSRSGAKSPSINHPTPSTTPLPNPRGTTPPALKTPPAASLQPITHHPSQSSSHHSPYDDEKDVDHITVDIHEVESTVPPAPPLNSLQLFHSALGIPPPRPPKPSTKKNAPPPKTHPNLTPANKGVYMEVLTNERWERWKYHCCSILITVAMFLQIIVGAAVTAFGAGSASHVIITVFGAANTALASLLAVLKSQGLPNRIRQDWNGWRELKEFIEEQEREIELVVSRKVEGRDINVWDVVKTIEGRYNAVRLTSEANRPDTYIRVPVPGR